MAVGAVIVIAFIGRWILQQNVRRVQDATSVGMAPSPETDVPPPENLPDGTRITIPEGGDLEVLSAVEDNTELKVDDPAFLYLIKSVMDQTPEEIGSRVDPEIDSADYFYRPSEYRGRYVRAVGTLDHLEPMWLPRDNPSGVERVWWGTLIDRDRKMVQVIVAEQERPFNVGHDTVMVEGPFFKMRSYVTIQGKLGKFPLVIGREMRYVHEPTYEETFPSELGYVVAGVVVLALAVILFASFRASRRDVAVDRIRRSRGRAGRPEGPTRGGPPTGGPSRGPEGEDPSS